MGRSDWCDSSHSRRLDFWSEMDGNLEVEMAIDTFVLLAIFFSQPFEELNKRVCTLTH